MSTQPTIITLDLPIRTLNETNQRGHWAKHSALHAEQRLVVRTMLVNGVGRLPAAPVVVTLTRFAPNLLDEDDNLNIAFKHVRDGIAEAYGIDDRHKALLHFRYAQERSREYGIRIQIESVTQRRKGAKES